MHKKYITTPTILFIHLQSSDILCNASTYLPFPSPSENIEDEDDVW